jgi:CPA2 family monovalent cation:H+ antiporter-2
MIDTLELVLMLLSSAVLAVAAFRSFNLAPVLGYLMVGATIGPNALSLVGDTGGARHLAEFGVVFLMFSIGLEFSLPRLYSMKRIVLGLGMTQVIVTAGAVVPIASAIGLPWTAGVALGGALALSSTALLSKLLADRLELDSAHGREVIGVLLAQDIAVVPLLILIPALSGEAGDLGVKLAVAAIKALAVLGLVLFLGQHLMSAWFHLVARRRSTELFMLNVLLITLGLAWLTEQAGLSMALGAFLAGMLISETEYRYQVEEDIKPFRDVLMGLFFVTVGMLLDFGIVLRYLPEILAALAALLIGKFVLAAWLSRAFGAAPGTALRTGLWLAAGGEFGFVLLAQAGTEIVPREAMQVTVSTLVLSMLLAPFIVQFSDRLVLRFAPSEWLLRSMELTRVAAQSMSTERHAIICGYGRSGQYLARFLEQESIPYMALDLDPERVREAGAAGDPVVYGDASRRETLIAAGVQRAAVVVISYANPDSAMRVMRRVSELRPELPVVVRAASEADLDRLTSAGAVEVVPELFEASVMLASHAMILMGVPLSRVARRVRELRDQRYGLMRGFFHGASDAAEDLDERQQPRLHSVTLGAGAHAAGRTIEELGLERTGARVWAVRRRNIRGESPGPETRLAVGDVVVLLGPPDDLARAEDLLLRGGARRRPPPG